MSKIRVLIVDDHALLREGIRSLLASHDDLEVVGEAADGREAIEKARELVPDVVLMDVAMPLMDGLEATRRISGDNPEVKVIILTQYDKKEYLLSGLKSGARGCLPKKVLAHELVAAIRVTHSGDAFLHPSVAKLVIEDYLQHVQHDPYDGLTRREREILKLVAEGRTNREIADLLGISIRTVLGHRTNVMEKLDIHNRTELIKYAIRKGLITVDT
ncbi:MAG: response regulator transcription factor [Dehalococcoidia bacterium]|nr:MAG: response regulator transcription factor [Dehalococcoidia bacterium]